MLWQNDESPPAICGGDFQHRSALSGWIFKYRFLQDICSCKTFAHLPQEEGTYRCGYVVCMSKASYAQEKGSVPFWQLILCDGNNLLPDWRILPCSLKPGKVVNRVKKAAVRLSWGGCLWWCSCMDPQSRSWDVHHWASSCRSPSLWGRKLG